MDTTPNLDLPYILAAQGQKHVTHNEAVRALDVLVQASVRDRDLSTPPGSPDEGDRYIVPAGADGAWSDQDGKIAAWQDSAWIFYAPVEGWVAWVVDESILVAFDGAEWVGAAAPATLQNLPALGLNTSADATNRLALASDASLFNHDGAGHQQKINKATAGDTASQLYQTNFSGRAEFGLTGDDHFHVKVSPDGATWIEAMLVDNETGRASFPVGLVAPNVPGRGEGSAADLLNGEEGAAFDFISRTALINDYADTLSEAGRPHDLLTVVRASSAAYIDRDGAMQFASNDELRYDHDPLTGVPLGALIEGSRINILLRSAKPNTSPWINSHATVTEDDQTAPDGNTTAALVECTTNGGTTICAQTTTIVADNTYTVSRYLKRGSVDWVRIRAVIDGETKHTYFNLATGALGTVDSAGTWATVSAAIEPAPNGFYRCSITVRKSTGTSLFSSACPAASDGGGSVSGQTFIQWGAQHELGAFMSSYIPTADASATRSADAVSIALSTIPNNATQGTLITESMLARQNAGSFLVTGGLRGADGNNRIFMGYASTGPMDVQMLVAGVGQLTGLTGNTIPTAGVVAKWGVAFRANHCAAAYNGDTPDTDDTASLPIFSSLSLGVSNAPGNQIFGWMRRARYLTRRVTNAELQAMTS